MTKLLIFQAIALIMVILSLLLPWYRIALDIDEIDGENMEAQYVVTDKLHERDEYIEITYLGITLDETESTSNDDLKETYPGTARCKSMIFVLVIIQIIMIGAILTVGSTLHSSIKPKRIRAITLSLAGVLIFSILIIGMFTFLYDPYDDDSEEEDTSEDEPDFTYSESGNWFYGEAEYSGDLVGTGTARIDLGYIFSTLGLIFLIGSIVHSHSLHKMTRNTSN